MAAVAHLGRRKCLCPFYAFTIRIVEGARDLEVSAGPGGEVAVHALLGLLDDDPQIQAPS